MLLEHRFHHGEFDAAELARRKRAAGLRVSVCLPTRDEAETVGAIVGSVTRELVERHPLVDEVLVVDDGSTDDTAAVAANAGATVVHAAEVLPEFGGSGKGAVLWRSLAVAGGDLVCWLDADLREFSPHFVTGLLGPLLTRPSIGFVKADYTRAHHDITQQGGRVTELVARPLISTFFPHLAGVSQPLGGEYAGRRSLLEAVPFVTGWGVELGLLVDVAEQFGVNAIAQVDLGRRVHRNRPLDELRPQAMAILHTALERAGAGEAVMGDDLLVHEDGSMARQRTDLDELPPLIEVVDSRDRHRSPSRSRLSAS